MPLDPSFTAPAALMIEAAVGYPAWAVRRIGHPVMLFGALIARLDRGLNREEDSFARRRLSGVVALCILLALCGGGAVLLTAALHRLPHGWLWEALAASTLLAQRSLYDHVRAVADGLRLEGLSGGRAAVAMIVGRDVSVLDRSGVSRAAIESLSENFSDGIVSPALWLLIGGLPGIVLYKAINTADSMIGHRSPRHEAFGWAAARLDDLVNLPGARLSALLIALAAAADRGAVACMAALRAAWADAGKHRSTNAGWPEAAMAGALGLRLGGPRRYGDLVVDGVWLGDGRETATAADIDAALGLYVRACGGLLISSCAWLTVTAL
jgi:adenosylcobinamide-phosphate synthase